MTAKKPGRPPAPEARDRVMIGEELMGKLKEMADRYGEKHGLRPTIPQLIGMMAAKSKL